MLRAAVAGAAPPKPSRPPRPGWVLSPQDGRGRDPAGRVGSSHQTVAPLFQGAPGSTSSATRARVGSAPSTVAAAKPAGPAVARALTRRRHRSAAVVEVARTDPGNGATVRPSAPGPPVRAPRMAVPRRVASTTSPKGRPAVGAWSSALAAGGGQVARASTRLSPALIAASRVGIAQATQAGAGPGAGAATAGAAAALGLLRVTV